MTSAPRPPAPDGLVVVDKPQGWTSHDVVARLRRLAGTRRVGHAGTLDPMATGVLLLGVGRATRLLGHLALHDKDYDATVRLGVATDTDDAEGRVVATMPAAGVPGEPTDDAIVAAGGALVGELQQVPPAYSAVKVDGRRSYARARAGEDVTLAARTVRVDRLDVTGIRRDPAAGTVDVDLTVTCSSGTYVRALARDLGAALGVGGHLTALRRTRVGGVTLDQARTLDQLEASLAVVPMAEVARASFPVRRVDDEEARAVAHGRRLPARGDGAGPVAVLGPDGALLALAEEVGGEARYLAVFA